MEGWLRLREPIDTPTAIGIGVVIGSNVVISLALNTQKLAHRRLNLEPNGGSSTSSRKSSATPPESSASRPVRARPRASSNASYGARAGSPTRYLPSTAVILETEPLLQRPPLRKAASGLPTAGGTGSDVGDRNQQVAHGVAAILPRRSSSLHSGSRKLVPKVKLQPKTPTTPSGEGDAVVLIPTEPSANGDSISSRGSKAPSRAEGRDSEEGHESDYLKSKLWRVCDSIARIQLC